MRVFHRQKPSQTDITATGEFHISRRAREDFQFQDTFFSIHGDTVLANFRAAQLFAETINQRRQKHIVPAAPYVQPAHIYAMGLLHEILHFVIDSYRRERNPEALGRCDASLERSFPPHSFEKFLETFTAEFPPLKVYQNQETPEQYLQNQTGGIPNRHIALEEFLLVWLQNENPAFDAISELIDDSELARNTIYERAIAKTGSFFKKEPKYGPANQSLIDMLRAPARASPGSIMGQLEFVKTHWQSILSDSPLLMKLLGAMDFVREEGKYLLMRAQAEADRAKKPLVAEGKFFEFGEKESAIVPTFKGALYEAEPERFSVDLDWMPRLVLIAKNTYVWLDQLSKQYQRYISRLDEIPGEELDVLARRGFTGLWLIGVWQRSRASERAKRISGNPEAIASAYSLNDYEIASELGGESAYRTLRDMAMQRGMRLASDMVPNHMGIDSSWVMNHPDWFVQSDYPPFPNYSFTGPDLSNDDRVGIYIEDGYWKKTDAAVVFKRLDRWTGDIKYIYHGNDGTHMPWNDTAQLNFMKPEVREAVIRTILHVARLFPVIRFDAAMVLSKKHYQRLWFPEPGTGGAIPSRAASAMTKEQFDVLMPEEFWREVVDRVQQESPQTLLLAEAFWLMEGYFVRTLGMHRVYNSAFMNMLKREENANYRSVVKNVLEYNPQILKRFVNFMNNPDEETAIAQFGKDDKYFGACIMMSTLPGLPMFGHGQIEGYGEKYGMEYRRAYYNETPDQHLVARHEREIFPLLKKRYLFADVENFLLYDFFTKHGLVNEDVFAYSNRFNGERALVVYNNKFAHTAGWVKTSVGFLNTAGNLVRQTLGDGLALKNNPDTYCIFLDSVSGLEYIRANRELCENGLYIELGAFKYHVFMNFREVQSNRGKPYDKLANTLDGKGVPSIEDALLDLHLQPIHVAFEELISHDTLRDLKNGWQDGHLAHEAAAAFNEKIQSILHAVEQVEHINISPNDLLKECSREFNALLRLAHFRPHDGEKQEWLNFIYRQLPVDNESDPVNWQVICSLIVLRQIRNLIFSDASTPESFIMRWRLEKPLSRMFAQGGIDEEQIEHELELLKVLDKAARPPIQNLSLTLKSLLMDEEARRFIRVNLWDGVLWFNKERFEELLAKTFVLSGIEIQTPTKPIPEGSLEHIEDQFKSMTGLIETAASCNYKLEEFLAKLAKVTAIASLQERKR